jgi:hypothetical protein
LAKDGRCFEKLQNIMHGIEAQELPFCLAIFFMFTKQDKSN